jgi:hypothetical protein
VVVVPSQQHSTQLSLEGTHLNIWLCSLNVFESLGEWELLSVC